MKNERILIVEDERLTRHTLAAFLQDAGYPTAAVADGRTAIELQNEQPFDVCIVDIRMPGLDGVQTLIALHQISPQSRLIVYTGSPGFTLPPSLENIGMSNQDIVRKPVTDMNVFLTLIQGDAQNPARLERVNGN